MIYTYEEKSIKMSISEGGIAQGPFQAGVEWA
jgi:hypothetical protein